MSKQRTTEHSSIPLIKRPEINNGYHDVSVSPQIGLPQQRSLSDNESNFTGSNGNKRRNGAILCRFCCTLFKYVFWLGMCAGISYAGVIYFDDNQDISFWCIMAAAFIFFALFITFLTDNFIHFLKYVFLNLFRKYGILHYKFEVWVPLYFEILYKQLSKCFVALFVIILYTGLYKFYFNESLLHLQATIIDAIEHPYLLIYRFIICINIFYFGELFKDIFIKYVSISKFFSQYTSRIKICQDYMNYIKILIGFSNIKIPFISNNITEFLCNYPNHNDIKAKLYHHNHNTVFEAQIKLFKHVDTLKKLNKIITTTEYGFNHENISSILFEKSLWSYNIANEQIKTINDKDLKKTSTVLCLLIYYTLKEHIQNKNNEYKIEIQQERNYNMYNNVASKKILIDNIRLLDKELIEHVKTPYIDDETHSKKILKTLHGKDALKDILGSKGIKSNSNDNNNVDLYDNDIDGKYNDEMKSDNNGNYVDYIIVRKYKKNIIYPQHFISLFRENGFSKRHGMSAFGCFDKGNNGEIEFHDMYCEIYHFLNEVINLKQTLHAKQRILTNLNLMSSLGLFIILLFLYLFVFRFSFEKALSLYLSILAIILIFLKGYLELLIDSMSLIFLLNPYKIGDTVYIKNKRYYVRNITLFTTIFSDIYGRCNVYKNSILLQKIDLITNLSRHVETYNAHRLLVYVSLNENDCKNLNKKLLQWKLLFIQHLKDTKFDRAILYNRLRFQYMEMNDKGQLKIACWIPAKITPEFSLASSKQTYYQRNKLYYGIRLTALQAGINLVIPTQKVEIVKPDDINHFDINPNDDINIEPGNDNQNINDNIQIHIKKEN